MTLHGAVSALAAVTQCIAHRLAHMWSLVPPFLSAPLLRVLTIPTSQQSNDVVYIAVTVMIVFAFIVHARAIGFRQSY